MLFILRLHSTGYAQHKRALKLEYLEFVRAGRLDGWSLILALGRQAVYNPYSARQFRKNAILEVRDT